MKKPRMVISSVSGKIGKTVITSAIIDRLRERGYKVQPFKIGPDFIDPSYHNIFSSLPSRNLDSIMFRKETIISSFCKAMENADISVIEGVFGLYDSINGLSERGSTAEVSKILRSPIVLIIDAERINRGLIAIVKGFREFDREVKLSGVIVNNVAHEKQRQKIVSGFREYFRDLEIVGIVDRNDVIEEKMKYRHLGLVPVPERIYELEEVSEALRQIGQQIDIDKLIEIASNVEEIYPTEPMKSHYVRRLKIRVGIIRDSIFSFYYPENVEYLQSVAEEVYYVDSVNDQSLPKVDLLYIGGGFPEVYAWKLEKNKSLKNEIRRRYHNGMKIYAECGGLIYLSDKVKTFDGEEYEMTGLIDGYIEMSKRPVGHGYVYLSTIRDNPLTMLNHRLIGHEFHYSRLILKENVDFAFKVERGYGIDGKNDGIMKENLLAMYTHLHFLHDPEIFRRLTAWSGQS